MSAIKSSFFGNPKKIEENFHLIYAGMSSFFAAAGYSIGGDGKGISVHDLTPEPGFSLETMVAVVSNFVREVWGAELAQFPISGQKAVCLVLRIPKPKKRRK